MTSEADRARQDFIAEAEELLDTFARGIGEVEIQGRNVKPSVINDVFRAVHSLKGIAGMFGVTAIAELAHRLEDLLDRLRLGKIQMSDPLVELLNDCVKALSRLVGWVSAGQSDAQPESASLLARIESFAGGGGETHAADEIDQLNLDPQSRRSLTEYEEHRLRENLRLGRNIFAIVVRYDFADFDTGLRSLTAALGDQGEVLSTLPTADPTGLGIGFQLLYGTEAYEEAVRALSGADAQLRALRVVAPVVEEAVAEDSVSIRSISPTIRVDVAKLDTVMNIVGELFLARTRLDGLVRTLRASSDRALLSAGERISRDVSRRLGELQTAVIDLRLVPVAQLYQRLGRVVRTLARELGKEVELITEGADTELDKVLVELAADPLMHIVRNALDHGIEPAEERVRAGKPAAARLILRAYPRGSSVTIDVIDDGRGIDLEGVRKKAIARGLVAEGTIVTREDAYEFLFSPGFSTAVEVSEISGRGVGLDVVRSNIHEMKGSIEVFSEPGKGSTFRITLPITLAIVSALIVRSGRERYAIPLTAVEEIVRSEHRNVVTVGGREAVLVREDTIPLLRLDHLGFSAGHAPGPQLYVVVVRAGERLVAIAVDGVEGQQEIVIKTVGDRIRRVPGIAGATDIGDDEIVLVLDVASLVDAFSGASRARERGAVLEA